MIDPIRFEIIRQAIDAAAQEMCVALYKSAYSTNIKTRLDLSCAILDRQGRVIGQSAASGFIIAQVYGAAEASESRKDRDWKCAIAANTVRLFQKR